MELELVPRVVTDGPWDAVWGGGIVPTSVSLIGGKPGAGKTSLLLQIANSVAEVRGRKAFFINVEMHGSEVKLAADRLKIAMDRIVVFSDFVAATDGDIEAFHDDVPAAIVIDSISSLAGRNQWAAIEIAKRCKRYAAKHHVPCFVVVHVTKQTSFSGLMSLQHEVDALITLASEESDVRTLMAIKNRYGRTHVKHRLVMTAHGLVTPPPDDWASGSVE